MSINSSMGKRLEKLEFSECVNHQASTIIRYDTVEPKMTPQGIRPGKKHHGTAYVIIGGETLSEKDYETREELLEAVNAEHERIHGQSIQFSKEDVTGNSD